MNDEQLWLTLMAWLLLALALLWQLQRPWPPPPPKDCAWCGHPMDEGVRNKYRDPDVSHGICAECAETVMAGLKAMDAADKHS